MGIEIERKFLVKDDSWRLEAGAGTLLKQGYLAEDAEATVRIRTDGSQAWLTIKGRAEGLSRAEFEYEVPVEDASALLAMCGSRLVEKRRFRIAHGGHIWEVDEFHGLNAGLIVAEVELASASEPVELPPWTGAEVSGDQRFQNADLSLNPFSCWDPAEKGLRAGPEG